MIHSKDDGQQIKMFNGQSVMNSLKLMNYRATENELSKHITTCTGQPAELVEQEVKRILDHGISNGFILKNGNDYSLPYFKDVYHIDADEGSDEDSEDDSSISSEGEADVTVSSMDDDNTAEMELANCIKVLKKTWPKFDIGEYVRKKLPVCAIRDCINKSKKAYPTFNWPSFLQQKYFKKTVSSSDDDSDSGKPSGSKST